MPTLSKTDLLTPQPVKIKDYEIDAGTIRIREQTISEANKFQAWLKPKGQPNDKRSRLKFLKLATMCLVDEDDHLLFDFPETKDGDNQFFEFAEQIGDDAAKKWEQIELKVMVHNGYLKEEATDELGE